MQPPEALVEELAVIRPGLTVVPVAWAGLEVYAVMTEQHVLAAVALETGDAHRGLSKVSRFAPLAPRLLLLRRSPATPLDVMMSAAVLGVGVLDEPSRTWLTYPEWADDRQRNARSLLLEMEAQKAAAS
jgi:hypothetical protein